MATSIKGELFTPKGRILLAHVVARKRERNAGGECRRNDKNRASCISARPLNHPVNKMQGVHIPLADSVQPHRFPPMRQSWSRFAMRGSCIIGSESLIDAELAKHVEKGRNEPTNLTHDQDTRFFGTVSVVSNLQVPRLTTPRCTACHLAPLPIAKGIGPWTHGMT